MCEHALLCSCLNTHEEMRGHFAGLSSLLLLCGFWELKSGHQTWQQVPLSTESSCQLDSRDFWTDRNPSIEWAVLCKGKRIVLSLFGSTSWRVVVLGAREPKVVGWMVWEFWASFRTFRALYCYRTLQIRDTWLKDSIIIQQRSVDLLCTVTTPGHWWHLNVCHPSSSWAHGGMLVCTLVCAKASQESHSVF